VGQTDPRFPKEIKPARHRKFRRQWTSHPAAKRIRGGPLSAWGAPVKSRLLAEPSEAISYGTISSTRKNPLREAPPRTVPQSPCPTPPYVRTHAGIRGRSRAGERNEYSLVPRPDRNQPVPSPASASREAVYLSASWKPRGIQHSMSQAPVPKGPCLFA